MATSAATSAAASAANSTACSRHALSSSALQPRCTGDGSFSLYSTAFGEGFHSAEGALAEALAKFVGPAELERFPAGRELLVLECCVGTGTNTAALIEAAAARGLRLRWWGLELDPEPLALSLADPGFRAQWLPSTLAVLETLHGQSDQDLASQDSGLLDPMLRGSMLWGDARRSLPRLAAELAGRCDLVLMDAFSPAHCPQLWTEEVLAAMASLLAPHGRWLSYCSAAAVRQALRRAGLHLTTILSPTGPAVLGETSARRRWSGGTAASPEPLPPSVWLRPLTPMEWEHLTTSAGHPYRDPSGCSTAAAIQQHRQLEQAAGRAEPSSAWRRRWGLEGHRR
ncbi:MnmC family methyltransferase [Synechococcus sp. CS-1328]|uniref:MnmC family methyltransferase n=1 Tax=Synechococcus sp. CS-1328 TaxID=2847976 RepID=UPI00223AB79D|nr:MnmC family methyltransferase [Synechococcus sp. CS-1328]MCT0226168.1 SAM-dependent methyltransferase [Synechococcus sp. CS-1328]